MVGQTFYAEWWPIQAHSKQKTELDHLLGHSPSHLLMIWPSCPPPLQFTTAPSVLLSPGSHPGDSLSTFCPTSSQTELRKN